MLALAKIALATLSPRRILAWANRPPRRPIRFVEGTEIDRISISVNHIGSQPWLHSLCLPRALAAQAMLRRRGIAGTLCLGVNREGGSLAAHAWIEFGQAVIVGGVEAPQFKSVARFGDGEARMANS